MYICIYVYVYILKKGLGKGLIALRRSYNYGQRFLNIKMDLFSWIRILEIIT